MMGLRRLFYVTCVKCVNLSVYWSLSIAHRYWCEAMNAKHLDHIFGHGLSLEDCKGCVVALGPRGKIPKFAIANLQYGNILFSY
jgi:hypothetical protein